jgi:hypothetical protein
MALITPTDIITLAFKDDNAIGTNHFTDAYIEVIEEKYIRPYFQDVFDSIIEKDGAGYTVNEQLLVDKIQHPLALFCKHDIAPELSLQINNSGVQTYSSDYSNPVSSSERVVVQKTIMSHAETLMDKVVRWYKLQDDLVGEKTQDNKDFNGDIVL